MSLPSVWLRRRNVSVKSSRELGEEAQHFVGPVLVQPQSQWKYTNGRTPQFLHVLSGCVHDATKNTHRKENKEMAHGLLVFSILWITVIFFCVLLKLLLGSWKRNPENWMIPFLSQFLVKITMKLLLAVGAMESAPCRGWTSSSPVF